MLPHEGNIAGEKSFSHVHCLNGLSEAEKGGLITLEKKKKLTTAAGVPVPDNQNAITAGPRGPMLMQDVLYQEQPEYKDPPPELSYAAAAWNFREDDADYYSQWGMLFLLMSKSQQKVLCGNTGPAMGDAPGFIKIRHIGNCLKADRAYGKGFADALGIPLDKVN